MATTRPGGIVELDQDGRQLRTFGDGTYSGVAVVGDQLWAGFEQIDRFDLDTGEPLGSIPLLDKLETIGAMFRSKPTKSLLIIVGDKVVEVDEESHEVIQVLTPPTTGVSLLDVTRGPDNRIIATGFGSVGLFFQWDENGTFLGVGTFPGIPFGLAWAGLTVADLEVQVSVSNQSPSVGETIEFMVEVTNKGPAVATQVVVDVPRADGLSPFFDAVASTRTFGWPGG